jgi:RecA-family ATPase
MSDEELSNESLVKSIMDWDASVRKRFNLFTWYIHHQRKAQATNKKPTDLSDVYGSHYITARATSVYCLWPEGPDIEVTCLKRRLSGKEKTYRLARDGDLEFTRKDTVGAIADSIDLSKFLEEDTSSGNGFGLDL